MTLHTIKDLERLGYCNTDQHFASLEIWNKGRIYALYNRREDWVEITMNINNPVVTIKEYIRPKKKRP